MKSITTFSVALLLTQTLLLSAEARRYDQRTNLRFDAATIATYPTVVGKTNVLLNKMTEKCDDTPGCVGFVIDKSAKTYSLKSQFTGAVVSSNHEAHILNMDVTYTSLSNRKFTILKGIEISGSTIYSIRGSLGNCKSECLQVPGCIGYSYSASSDLCVLKSQSLTKKIDPSFVTYLVDVNSPARRAYTIASGTDLKGDFTGSFEGSFTECPSACDRAPDCKLFTLNLPQGRGCTFLNGSNKLYSPPSGTISFKLHTDNSFVPPKEYFQINGFSFNGEQLASFVNGNCEAKCNETSGCVYYTLSSVSGSKVCNLRGHPTIATPTPGSTAFMTISYEKGYTYDDLPSEKSLYLNDRLKSPNGTSILSVNNDRTLTISKYSVRALILGEDVISAKAHTDGSLLIRSTYAGDKFLRTTTESCSGGSWKLVISDEMVVRVFNPSCPTLGFNSKLSHADFPFSGYNAIYANDPKTHSPSINQLYRNINDGRNVVVYYLDSGVNTDYDIASSWHQDLNGKFTYGPTYSNSFPSEVDVYGHGTTMITILKSNLSGIAQSAEAVSVKITDLEERFFSEKSFVQAVSYVQKDKTFPSHSKIINFSGNFAELQNKNIINCAIQWAFYSNIAVIAASGNQNKHMSDLNPYQITVGGFSFENGGYKAWNESNHGPEIDIWAPVEVIGKEKVGTSFSTGYTSAVLAAAISRWPSLANNPNRSYKYLKSLIRTDLLSGDTKAKTSTYNTGALSMNGINQAPTDENNFKLRDAKNFCGIIGLHQTIPDWNALISRSSPTRLGGIVSSTNVISCNDFLSRDCD